MVRPITLSWCYRSANDALFVDFPIRDGKTHASAPIRQTGGDAQLVCGDHDASEDGGYITCFCVDASLWASAGGVAGTLRRRTHVRPGGIEMARSSMRVFDAYGKFIRCVAGCTDV